MATNASADHQHWSGEGLDAAMLSDGDLEKTTQLPISEPGSESWIQFEYPAPQAISAVTYVTLYNSPDYE